MREKKLLGVQRLCLRFCVTEFASFGQNFFLLTVAVLQIIYFSAPLQCRLASHAPTCQNLHAIYTYAACARVHTAADNGYTQKPRLPQLQRYRQTFNKPKLAFDLTICTTKTFFGGGSNIYGRENDKYCSK